MTEGTRKPTLPEDLWAKVRPLLQKTIGVGKPLKVTEIAEALGIKPPSVSAWINDNGRPNSYNLRKVMHLIRKRCPQPDIQRDARAVLGELGDTLAAAEEAAQRLTDLDNVHPDRAWLLMRGLNGDDTNSLYAEARAILGAALDKTHSSGVSEMLRSSPSIGRVETG